MTIKVTYNVTDVYMSQSVSPVYINVSYSDGGVSGGGVWGSITGTLSNQTDLQTALDLKVPYSGATGNVNLAEYELKAGQVTLDTSPTGTAAVGTIRWNDTTGTSETTLKGGNVIIKNGVDLVARVVNKVSPNTTLTKAAYQAVRVSGAQGQRLAIELAQANNDAGSADTIGLVTETIAPNQEGFIMTVGQLEGINTTGSLQGETWVDGDVLYLSPTTAGAITNVKPTAVTGHIVVIGYVEYAHVNNGKIYVKVMNGWELDELHNVSIVTPANNQGLFYNSSNSLWENKTISTALGYTPVPTTRNITINGVTYDLSADRTWTISTGISGSAASGQVTYWTGASAVSGSNNLFWDNAKNTLAVKSTIPSVVASVASQTFFGRSAVLYASDTANDCGFNMNTYFDGTSNRYKNNGQVSAFYLDGAGNIGLYTGPNGTAGTVITSSEKFRLFNNGNVLIQNGGTFTDLGTRLGVVGDTLLRGSGNTSATTALTVQNSDSTAMMQLLNNGYLRLGSGGTSAVRIYPTDTTGDVELSGLSLAFNSRITSQSTVANIGMVMINGLNGTATSGAQVVFLVSKGFAPTSGTGTYVNTQISPVINQTGGANGITRGLYVNPTLTAAADFRAIETTAGNVLFGSNFFWDNTNSRLGIGTNAPEQRLHVLATAISTAIFSHSGTDGGIDVRRTSALETGRTSQIRLTNGTTFFGASDRSYQIINIARSATTTDLQFQYWDGTSYLDRFRLFSSGNFGINTGTTDSGQRLQVIGDTLLRGSGATSATTALTVQNSSSTNLFTVRNDGAVAIGTTLSAWSGNTTPLQISGGALWNFGSTNIYLGLNYYFNGSSRIYIQSAAASEYRQSSGEHYWYSAVSGTAGSTISFTQTMRLNINGYLGIGTNAPTALTDIGESTTTRASLRIRSGIAPTTPNDGDIWFDGTDIKMRIGGVTKTFTLI